MSEVKRSVLVRGNVRIVRMRSLLNQTSWERLLGRGSDCRDGLSGRQICANWKIFGRDLGITQSKHERQWTILPQPTQDNFQTKRL